MDLVGGYDDAGDNVKFHFPMAFTVTILSWKHPGSEVSAEIAASVAASSIAISNSEPDYSALLLNRAIQVFEFADTYQGSYNESIGYASCPFYCDYSGYMDDLIWAASWLYKATKEANYWNYVKEYIHYLEFPISVLKQEERFVGGSIMEFGWDTNHAGINVLVSQWVVTDPFNADPFIPAANQFVCSIFLQSPTKSILYTPGGLMFKAGGNNIQHATSISFLLVVYAQYMKAANRTIQCRVFVAVPSSSWLVSLARAQVDYILGSNPLSMSYMVGYGEKFPQKIHHRGSTMPSIDDETNHICCHGGDAYFIKERPNPNLLIGALVGGPAEDDSFKDSRYDVGQSEPTTH
ncbi:hypothetical protein FEM48_Zijuj03G0139800 [Ziziphus jujuba var. spinosa]|uniref:Endoglucanase n=1 Tax=Ziziphus jujuba var. spinosa TaxID=714518 RepID=A0A978VQQ3_ZIZJJ|nr:hypothetical protein FEM48_Zijuj03G0139800 [Ziziphus jujuba var. spinosa]